MSPVEQRELCELWLLAGEGQADAAQIARLNSVLEGDESARGTILGLARQQSWLAWNAADTRLPAALEALGSEANGAAKEGVATVSATRPSSIRGTRWGWLAIAASVLGFLAGQWLADPGVADVAANQQPLIQATMVSSTGCIWGPGNSGSTVGGRGLSGGDSLQLLEGIAEFRVDVGDSDVRVQMEGPASMVLTAHGAASISYGKIIVRTGEQHAGLYPIETSFGRVLAQPGSQIGLIGFGSTAEIHCFRGRATVESPWLRSNENEVASVSLATGEALEFDDVGGATLAVKRTIAEAQRFTPQVSMSTDFLSVSADYVRNVVAANPIAYWRFEEAAGGIVRNEVNNDYQGRVKGDVTWAGPEGNRAIELGLDAHHGSIVAAGPWDGVLAEDFTIELWMKPSHHHLGSMVGFVGEFDPLVQRNKHGVLLETCGPSGPSDWLRVRQLRFLHRAQLTANAADGVSCFSGKSYDARRWQHVAAVKQGGELRLYVDGELVQTAHDDEPTPSGLQLVIGQLYTETVERFFIGQLDEVAIYDRALDAEEVAEHHELLRPAKARHPSGPSA
jgi:hypothetical protein